MNFYRVVVVREGIRRVIDLPAMDAQDVAQKAKQDGWQVSYVALPASAELLPGILEEPADLLMN